MRIFNNYNYSFRNKSKSNMKFNINKMHVFALFCLRFYRFKFSTSYKWLRDEPRDQGRLSLRGTALKNHQKKNVLLNVIEESIFSILFCTICLQFLRSVVRPILSNGNPGSFMCVRKQITLHYFT